MKFSSKKFNDQISFLVEPNKNLVEKTDYPDIYKIKRRDGEVLQNNIQDLIIITGPSRAGKDSIIDALLTKDAYNHIKTATTRTKRNDEEIDDYTWMRQRLINENMSDYVNNLIKEYGLIEYDVHHDDVYGLPYNNLQKAEEEIALLNTDTRGIRTLKDVLSNQYKLTSIFVCPENADDLILRMDKLKHKTLARLAMAQLYIEDAAKCVDYVIVNKTSDNVSIAMDRLASQLDKLIKNEIV